MPPGTSYNGNEHPGTVDDIAAATGSAARVVLGPQDPGYGKIAPVRAPRAATLGVIAVAEAES